MDPTIARSLEGLKVQPIVPPGGFRPISPSDPEAISHAQTAVAELNRNRSLRFQSILHGRRASVQGPVYDLVIAAADGASRSNTYRLEFWIGREGCQIISFRQV